MIAPVLSCSQMANVVVVDTSVFVAALKSAGGAARQVLRLCLQKEITPIMGHRLFLEFEDVLNRTTLYKGCPLNAVEREALFHAFISVSQWTGIYYLWRPNLPDEGDNHVLELAVAGNAKTVITHNVADFRGELSFPGVAVQTPAQFLNSLR